MPPDFCRRRVTHAPQPCGVRGLLEAVTWGSGPLRRCFHFFNFRSFTNLELEPRARGTRSAASTPGGGSLPPGLAGGPAHAPRLPTGPARARRSPAHWSPAPARTLLRPPPPPRAGVFCGAAWPRRAGLGNSADAGGGRGCGGSRRPSPAALGATSSGSFRPARGLPPRGPASSGTPPARPRPRHKPRPDTSPAPKSRPRPPPWQDGRQHQPHQRDSGELGQQGQ